VIVFVRSVAKNRRRHQKPIRLTLVKERYFRSLGAMPHKKLSSKEATEKLQNELLFPRICFRSIDGKFNPHSGQVVRNQCKSFWGSK
jgi:hypothetical protein